MVQTPDVDIPSINAVSPACVLLLGETSRLADRMSTALPWATIRMDRTANESEGIGVDVVVLAGDFPLYDLAEVQVHPRLQGNPVIVFAPGHEVPDVFGDDVIVITDTDDPEARLFDALSFFTLRPPDGLSPSAS